MRGPWGADEAGVKILAGDREREGERCTPTRPGALGPDAAPVGVHEMARNGQPEAAPPPSSCSGPIGPVEALEDVGEMLGGDAGARIRNVDADPAVLTMG